MGNIFARRQVRCSCGKFSTTEIIISISTKSCKDNNGFISEKITGGYRDLEKISGGYKGWILAPFSGIGPRVYPCDKCAKDIIKNLKNNKIIFVTKRSEDGFLITDIP